ncbi:MAG: hypothetical protein KPEEDBHJ_00216 [Anaerolineales bacterium]|nr:hypothetical protein [Anaerolineales bacterium]HRJ54934.1 hypothetical protein [Anaerolineales bacterium]HRK89057.1 hypothetical protein [Anaerolineales bacterium]
MSDVLQAILIAVVLIPVSMLIGSVLYIVIQDAIRRNMCKD